MLILLFILFITVGLIGLTKKQAGRKEKLLFTAITTLGGILWGSILANHPIDLNKFIAGLLEQLF